jgi:Ca-activated chloride channel family protein
MREKHAQELPGVLVAMCRAMTKLKRSIVLFAALALCACGSSKTEEGNPRASANNAGEGGGDQTPHDANAGPNAAGGTSGTGAFSNPGGAGGVSGASGSFASGGAGGGAGTGGFNLGDSAMEEAPANTGDDFSAVGINPFVFVEHDPFSTFAADVDTASYDVMRRDLSLGFAPIADSVRVEDYVNYFSYDYPAPAEDAEHPFAIALAAAPHPVRAGITLLRVGIQAVKPAASEKKPANIVFLIDVSGSMQSEEKLPLVQRTLTQALSVLDANDLVSIVTYAGSTEVRLAPTRVLEAATISGVINSLNAGSGTNGAAGIDLAYAQAQAGFIEGGINHVVLCTDGDFNLGPSSDDALVALIEEKRQTGVTLTALGYGIGNLNDSMMEKVSNAGDGIYSVISSPIQADRYAEERLLSTFVHVAKDMKIQLELNPEHVLAYRLLGYENRAIADDDFRDDAIDAGEIGAGHRVTALYELVMVGGEVPDLALAPEAADGEPVEGTREIAGDDLVLVKVRYKQPGASAEDPAVEVQSTLAPALAETTLDAADLDLKWAIAMAMFAEVLKGSPYASAADLEAIDELTHIQAGRDAYRTELVELLETYRGL